MEPKKVKLSASRDWLLEGRVLTHLQSPGLREPWAKPASGSKVIIRERILRAVSVGDGAVEDQACISKASQGGGHNCMHIRFLPTLIPLTSEAGRTNAQLHARSF